MTGFHHLPYSLGPEGFKTPVKVIMKRFLKYLKPYKLQILLLTLMIASGTIASMVGPYLLGEAIDKFIVKGDFQGLLLISFLYLTIEAIGWLSQSGRAYILSRIGQRVLNKLRYDVFSHIQNLSFSFFDKSRAGDLISRVMNDTSVIYEVLISGIFTVASDILILAGIIAMMASMNIPLTLASVSVTPIMATAAYLFSSRFRKAYKETREKMANVTIRVQESVAGARVIKSFAREEGAFKTFKEASEEAFQANIQAARVSASFGPMIRFMASLGTCIVLWSGGYLKSIGWVTVGVLVAFLAFVNRFFRPIMELTMFYETVQAALAAAERILNVMDAEPEVKDVESPVKLQRVKGEITFENVAFSYVKGLPVLNSINLKIKPGEKVAIVGPTGGGKTTIVNLLCRFYDVDEGRILIDGFNIREVAQETLRRQIGLVPQETFLFPGTVKENIAVGKPEASGEEVEDVCRKLGVYELLANLPKGYETDVGEQGAMLSTGQKQLISFARAMLKNPPIIILDEAMSSIDPHTELLMKRAMAKLLEKRTAIIIAHRLTLARDCERIIVVDGGRAIEEGPHEYLMANEGLYRQLYESQIGEIAATPGSPLTNPKGKP